MSVSPAKAVAEDESSGEDEGSTTIFRTRKPLDMPVTQFYITGFGRFALVADNPTEQIVRRLGALTRDPAVQSSWQRELFDIADLRVLEVSAAAVHKAIADMKALCIQSQRAMMSSSGRDHHSICFLHLGVDVSADGLIVEKVAVNEALFRFPDERGWQPTTPVPVVDSVPLGAQYVLDLEALKAIRERAIDGLRKRGTSSLPIRIGDDAGRFLCNYLFYVSAHERMLPNGDSLWKSYFVHFPTTRVASLEIQMDALWAILRAIAAWNAQQEMMN
jgi:pyrrolidone-carboxylate peptidase